MIVATISEFLESSPDRQALGSDVLVDFRVQPAQRFSKGEHELRRWKQLNQHLSYVM